jgi:hypothetical protein
VHSVPPAAPVDLPLQLLESLRAFDAAVAASRAGQAADFQTLFRRLEELAAQLPADADPRLRHFLEQKSYQKARALLEASQRA